MRALDGPILEMPCAGPDNLEACSRPQDCSVHDVFERVHDSLAVALAGTNLAEAAMAAGGPPYPMAVRRQRRAHQFQGAARHRMSEQLEIRDLEVSIAGKKILKGLSLTVGQGEVHALMGPNGRARRAWPTR